MTFFSAPADHRAQSQPLRMTLPSSQAQQSSANTRNELSEISYDPEQGRYDPEICHAWIHAIAAALVEKGASA